MMVSFSQSILNLFSLASSMDTYSLSVCLAKNFSLNSSYSFLSSFLYSADLSSLNSEFTIFTVREASPPCTTVLRYFGAIFTAVWALEVVAPPTSNGKSRFCLSNSDATYSISSRLGVIKPLSPMISTFCSIAV